MRNELHLFRRLVILGAALILAAPLSAQQPAGTAGKPSEAPTKHDPLRFSAFNVSMPTGAAGVTEIAIERWTTSDERTKLLELVETAKLGEDGQRKLLDALQRINPRVGLIWTPNSTRMGSEVHRRGHAAGRHPADCHCHGQAGELRGRGERFASNGLSLHTDRDANEAEREG